MIVQEDVPYTKEEVKAMVKTIHDLREKLSLLGWHPASERPVIPEEKGSVNIVAYCITPSGICAPMEIAYIGRWPDNIKWWCYPPKEE